MKMRGLRHSVHIYWAVVELAVFLRLAVALPSNREAVVSLLAPQHRVDAVFGGDCRVRLPGWANTFTDDELVVLCQDSPTLLPEADCKSARIHLGERPWAPAAIADACADLEDALALSLLGRAGGKTPRGQTVAEADVALQKKTRASEYEKQPTLPMSPYPPSNNSYINEDTPPVEANASTAPPPMIVDANTTTTVIFTTTTTTTLNETIAQGMVDSGNCEYVCSKSDCTAHWLNPIPSGQRWLANGTKPKGCCAGGLGECQLCCRPVELNATSAPTPSPLQNQTQNLTADVPPQNETVSVLPSPVQNLTGVDNTSSASGSNTKPGKVSTNTSAAASASAGAANSTSAPITSTTRLATNSTTATAASAAIATTTTAPTSPSSSVTPGQSVTATSAAAATASTTAPVAPVASNSTVNAITSIMPSSSSTTLPTAITSTTLMPTGSAA